MHVSNQRGDEVARDAELDRLKAKQDQTFQRQQEAFRIMKRKQDQQHLLYEQQQVAWNRRQKARDEMNREYDRMQADRAQNDRIWSDYKRIRDYNNSRISSLKPQADSIYRSMVSAFERASSAYNGGDKASAPGYAEEGRRYKATLQSLNSEIKALGAEVKSAKSSAEALSGGNTNAATFNSAKSRFQDAKSEHESIQAKFKIAKAEYDRAKAAFKDAQSEHQKARDAREMRKAILRTEKEKEVSKVEMAVMLSNSSEWGVFDGKRARIKPKNDGSGKIDVYFGGLSVDGDGVGHGHVVIDGSQVVYMRQPWKDKYNPDDIDIDEDRNITNI